MPYCPNFSNRLRCNFGATERTFPILLLTEVIQPGVIQNVILNNELLTAKSREGTKNYACSV